MLTSVIFDSLPRDSVLFIPAVHDAANSWRYMHSGIYLFSQEPFSTNDFGRLVDVLAYVFTILVWLEF